MDYVFRGCYASEKDRHTGPEGCGAFLPMDRGPYFVCQSCGKALLEWERREAKA